MPRTKKVSSIALILLFISIGGIITLLFLLNKTNKEVIENIIEQERSEQFLNELRALDTLVENTQEERAQLQSYILRSENVIDFVSEIETIGLEWNTNLTVLSLGVTPLNETMESLNVNVNISGTYNSVVQIIELFEMLPYQSSISKVTLRNTVDGKIDRWEALLSLHVTKLMEL